MSDYKLVPLEPTPEMLEAGKYALDAGCHASGIYADMLAAAPAVQGEPVRDFPTGAIENGKAFAERLESYSFECEGGNLSMCSDWKEFRRCFEHLTEWATSAPQHVERKPAPDVSGLVDALEKALHLLYQAVNLHQLDTGLGEQTANTRAELRTLVAAYRKGERNEDD